MKISSDNPKETIQKSRPHLKDNTVKQYELHLNKLKKLFDSTDFDFLSKPDDVMEKISSNHYTSQRNTLNAVIILLHALNSDEKYNDLIEDYQKRRDIFNQQYLTDQSDGKISESQSKNFVELDEIMKMITIMENDIKSQGLKKKTNLTGKEKELLMVYTIFSMLVKYPVRLDFSGMKLISKTQYNQLKEDDKKLGNYLINEKGKLTMILNEYKTSKKYGEKKIPIDKDIAKIIRMYIKATGKTNGDVLFTTSTGHTISRNSLSQLLTKWSKKILNKSISTTIMRKVVVSSTIPKEILDKQSKLANIMGHDVATQNLVYNKTKD